MNWYSIISCDNTVQNPFVADLGDLGPHEEFQLRSCAEIRDWPGAAWVRASDCVHDGDPDDVLQTLLDLPIYSARLQSAIEAAHIGGIQFLPLRVLRPSGTEVEGYCIANILNCVRALDLHRSDFDRFPNDYFLPQRRGQIRALRKAVLERDALSGHDIIRLSEYKVAVYVSQHFVNAFEEDGFSGYSFRRVATSGHEDVVSNVGADNRDLGCREKNPR